MNITLESQFIEDLRSDGHIKMFYVQFCRYNTGSIIYKGESTIPYDMHAFTTDTINKEIFYVDISDNGMESSDNMVSKTRSNRLNFSIFEALNFIYLINGEYKLAFNLPLSSVNLYNYSKNIIKIDLSFIGSKKFKFYPSNGYNSSQRFDISKEYMVGDRCIYNTGFSDYTYQCIRNSYRKLPIDSGYWECIGNVDVPKPLHQHYHQIDTEFDTTSDNAIDSIKYVDIINRLAYNNNIDKLGIYSNSSYIDDNVYHESGIDSIDINLLSNTTSDTLMNSSETMIFSEDDGRYSVITLYGIELDEISRDAIINGDINDIYLLVFNNEEN